MITSLVLVFSCGVAFFLGYKVGANDAINAIEWVLNTTANAEETLKVKYEID